MGEKFQEKMKTQITIADGEIHIMVVNYESEKRDDMIIKIDSEIEHHEVYDKYQKQIKDVIRVLTYITN